MVSELKLINVTRNCFSTFASRLIFVLIAKNDFCTRNELTRWTNFSSITISRYLQEFNKAGLTENAPGIIYLSEFGKQIFYELENLLENELEFAKQLKLSDKVIG